MISTSGAFFATASSMIAPGPYKFVSFTPGVELVLEAFERYWRKKPSVKRMVLR